MKKFIKNLALKIPYVRSKYEYIQQLSNSGMKYQSCDFLDSFGLIFRDSVDIENRFCTFCAEPKYADNISSFAPGIGFKTSVEETVNQLIIKRANIISESVKYSILDKFPDIEERKYTSECIKCANYRFINGKSDNLIHYINLSMPAPCPCKCFYCDARNAGLMNKGSCNENYEKIFEAINYLKRNNFVSKECRWQISSGEIAIHPFKDQIFHLLNENDYSITFHTNCFIFDEKIANVLSLNNKSCINLSIDSGTGETWFKIKGVNNFNIVMENLKKYYSYTAKENQITFKYIVLPGINDNNEDYKSVVNIMKKVKNNYLHIACDCRYKYTRTEKEREEIINASANLTAMLIKNKMGYYINETYFLYDDIVRIKAKAKELLRK